jgi:hypothetical protein
VKRTRGPWLTCSQTHSTDHISQISNHGRPMVHDHNAEDPLLGFACKTIMVIDSPNTSRRRGSLSRNSAEFNNHKVHFQPTDTGNCPAMMTQRTVVTFGKCQERPSAVVAPSSCQLVSSNQRHYLLTVTKSWANGRRRLTYSRGSPFLGKTWPGSNLTRGSWIDLTTSS